MTATPDATALAHLLRRGEVTAVELVEAAIERIERLNPALNTVITRMDGQARTAAAAAGIVPMAYANDGGGSIRIPASCCGLFGLKPTRAHNPMGPGYGDAGSGLAVEHAVTRSDRESAALLDATSGPAPGDPYYAPPKERPYVEEVGRDPGQLHIAVSTRALTGAKTHPECETAVEATAKLCKDLGHIVEWTEPRFDKTSYLDSLCLLGYS